MLKSAIFSRDRRYRYTLTREWQRKKGTVVFVCLNPSTADENVNDNTVRKCIKFTDMWGYGKFIMLNIFAYRSTNPKKLYKVGDPIGSRNDFYILNICQRADLVIIAWGTHGAYLNRHQQVLKIIDKPFCLEVTQKGFPKHPLYITYKNKPKLYKWEV